MNRLVVPEKIWADLTGYLLSDDCEHLAFIFAEHVPLGGSSYMLAREVLLISEEDLEDESGWDGLSLNLDALLRVMNRANRLGCALIEAHSHPFSVDQVDFSAIDMRGQREMVAYLNDVFPGRPYGALVLAQKAIKGHLWLPGKGAPERIDQVRVTGSVLRSFGMERPFGGQNEISLLGSGDEVYNRQVLALGVEGQRRVEATRVGIVGLGGIGSMVAQQLAYLGVPSFVLVDHDIVEVTNLHRLVTATHRDIGRPKVTVAQRLIGCINLSAEIHDLCASVREPDTLEALKGCDVIFGCVDSDSGRLILNELCNAYLIPYIDCGVGINAEHGRITEAGGRVIVWVPDRPCLLCAKEINLQIAAEELESPQEQAFRRKHGYVVGANVPEPAVISLNGTVASLAVTEFLALITALRPSSYYTYYDLLEQRVGPRIVSKDDRCTACRLQGLGDKAELSRYSRVGLPNDLPRA